MNTLDQENRSLLSVAEVRQRLPLSKARLYQLLGTGELGSVRIGKRLLVDADDLENFIQNHRRQPLQLPLINKLRKTQEKEKLRSSAFKLLGWRTLGRCGSEPIPGLKIMSYEVDGQRWELGWQKCQNYKVCAVCATSWAWKQKKLLKEAVELQEARGGRALMAMLTISHTDSETLEAVLARLDSAWGKLNKDRNYEAALEMWGVLGKVRSLEIIYQDETKDRDAAGWHPHYHVLFFANSDIAPDEAEAVLAPLWGNAAEKAGGYASLAYGCKVVPLYAQGAGYVAKYPLSDPKPAEGRSAWRLLQDFTTYGELDTDLLFREYAQATRNKPFLTGLRPFLKKLKT